MAKAVKRPVSDYEYVLTLSDEEAKALHAITGLITGDPFSSNRKLTSGIRAALGSAGIFVTSANMGFDGNINAT